MIRRVMVAGGGTGGHLFPGIAVIEELRRRDPDLQVVFVGTRRGIENRVLPNMGEQLEHIDVTPLKGRSSRELGLGVLRLPRAIGRGTAMVRKHRPDLVLGLGGYASGPLLLGAAALGVPTALLEQNARVGLTNRILAPVVGRAYVAFEETVPTFSKRSVRVVGNPVRRGFVMAARRAVTDPDGFEARARRILVLGGSQGARVLNQVVPPALAAALQTHAGITVLHQTGESMREQVTDHYKNLRVQADVVPFIEDMADAYASASLVIARAGATTVAELCAIGRPSILVPYPHAADDHQTRNAESLARVGASLAIGEPEFDQHRLAHEVQRILLDDERRFSMAAAARGRGRPEAAAAVVDDLCDWLGCRRDRITPVYETKSGSSDPSSTVHSARAAIGVHRGAPYPRWGTVRGWHPGLSESVRSHPEPPWIRSARSGRSQRPLRITWGD